MITTSQDVFFLTLSVCLVFLTIFICWSLFYFGRLLKQSNQMLEEFRQRLDEVYAAIVDIKQSVTASASQVGVVAASVSQLISFFSDRKSPRKKK